MGAFSGSTGLGAVAQAWRDCTVVEPYEDSCSLVHRAYLMAAADGG